VRAFNPFSVEDGEDVADTLAEGIGRGIVRRITAALTAGIEEDEAIGITKGFDVAGVFAAPVFETAEEADVEDQRGSAALELVVNTDAVILGVGRGRPSPPGRRRALPPLRASFTLAISPVESWLDGEPSHPLSRGPATRFSPVQPRPTCWRLAPVPSRYAARRDRR
jgi:hypothetical protein